MGFRFRKSFGGKYFKVNISKSGVGYSYGVPGFRKTKMANGRTRTTASLVGTGLSYVTESSNKKKTKATATGNNTVVSVHQESLNDIDNVNQALFEESNETEFVNAIKKAKQMYNIAKWLIILGCIFILGGGTIFCSLVMIPLGIILMHHFNKNLKVNVEYTFESGEDSYKAYKELWMKLNKNRKVWEITSAVNNTDTKYSSGASRTIERNQVHFNEKKIPYLCVNNQKILTLKLRKKEVLFLPDKLLIIQGKQIAVVNYSNLSIKLSERNCVEHDGVASDSKVVDHTWKYLNKNGTPDKRFSDNRQLPVCLYGKIEIADLNNNFCVELQMSSYDIYSEIKEKLQESIK